MTMMFTRYNLSSEEFLGNMLRMKICSVVFKNYSMALE